MDDMNRLVVKLCAGAAVAAAIGFGAAPTAGAQGIPLDPAAPAATDTTPVEAAPIFVPETGSAAPYNNFMCLLHTVSASAPCMYT
ncbi:hypothetical protein B0T44_11635 [Nocardia donostiensis]|uniref:Uncharacterized protein n=2 Tax=Nocardia donostiensis TaxID=1538463 RepID=A0A1W0BCD3_9NOCA|nr:hypothetical protein B0T46_19645 [Nocardia donostiensis]OQS15157.1 hypothetical protein B0T36_10910 [Nocardia donostiensis]OQS20167.1 hypothetical protein B0T44_11635 [Nocardia donostiensis]